MRNMNASFSAARFFFTLISACIVLSGCGGGSSDSPEMATVAGAPTAVIDNKASVRSVEVNSIVKLDGSGSFTGEENARFYWTLTSKPPGSRSSIMNPESVTTEVCPDVPGEYRIELLVSTDTGQSAESTILLQAINWNPEILNWGFEKDGSAGEDPSVAVNNHGVVVEVHEASNLLSNTLYYRVGLIRGGIVEWGDSHSYNDDGYLPSVDINDDGVVVEMHQNRPHPAEFPALRYHVGLVNAVDKTINFGFQKTPDDASGHTASIAINNSGDVVEVHRSQQCEVVLGVTFGCNLLYRVGRVVVNEQRISFGSERDLFDDNGTTPAVDMNDQGAFVEVHKSQNDNDLWYWTGTVDAAQKKLLRGTHGEYSSGMNPDVSINDQGRVVVVQESADMVSLYSKIGRIDGTHLSLHPYFPYDIGAVPSVSLNNENQFVEIHDMDMTASGLVPLGKMSYHLSTDFLPPVNPSNWMEQYPVVQNRTLRNLTLPGTHDSGAYWLNRNATGPDYLDEVDLSCDTVCLIEDSILCSLCELFGIVETTISNDVAHDVTLAHSKNLEEQLEGGIRYFDLRATISNGEFYTYHGLIGEPIDQILDDIKSFMENVKSEVVIIYLSSLKAGTDRSNSRSFTNQEHAALLELIVGKLGQYIYPRHDLVKEDLLSTRVRDIVADGPKLIVYCDDYVGDHPEDPNTEYFWDHDRTFKAGDGLLVLTENEFSVPGDRRANLYAGVEIAYMDIVKDSEDNDVVVGSARSVVDHVEYDVVLDLTSVTVEEPILTFALTEHDKLTAYSGFLVGGYKDTTDIVEQEKALREKFADYSDGPRNSDLFRLYQTLTANESVITQNLLYKAIGSDYIPTLHSLTQDANHHLGTFLGENDFDKPNIILVDFFEESDVVAQSILLSTACIESPVEGEIFAVPNQLWAPNHKFQPVEIDISGLISANAEIYEAKIVSVNTLEYDRKTGESFYKDNNDNHNPDWEITGDLTLNLRSERSGGSMGRIYEVTLQVTDCSGTYDFKTDVTVPHDQRD